MRSLRILGCRMSLIVLVLSLPVSIFAQLAGREVKVSANQVKSANRVDSQLKSMGNTTNADSGKNAHYYTVTPSRYPSGNKPVFVSYEPAADSSREVIKHLSATGAAKVPVKVGGR